MTKVTLRNTPGNQSDVKKSAISHQLPIASYCTAASSGTIVRSSFCGPRTTVRCEDRKSTRLNSSHPSISYAVFCLKKKKNKYIYTHLQLNWLTMTLCDSSLLL